jgi:hypothetical protein
MKTSPAAILSLLLVFVTNRAGAQGKVDVCSLLTASEIEAGVGTKPGAGHAASHMIGDGPAKGETMNNCSWPTGALPSMFGINVIPVPAGVSREQGIAMIKKSYTDLLGEGWTEEKHDFGDAYCSLLTPPADDEAKRPIVSACMGEAKGLGVSVMYMSPTKKLTMDNVKALYDHAVGRLK